MSLPKLFKRAVDVDFSYVTFSQHPNLPNISEHYKANIGQANHSRGSGAEAELGTETRLAINTCGFIYQTVFFLFFFLIFTIFFFSKHSLFCNIHLAQLHGVEMDENVIKYFSPPTLKQV